MEMFSQELILLILIVWLNAVSCNVTSTISTVSTQLNTQSSAVTTKSSISTILATTTEGTCAVNNETCKNATKALATQESHTKWQNEPMPTTYYKFKISNKSDCGCDLRYHRCEINCCCDTDCTFGAKQVFSFCKDEIYLPSPNIKYCNYIHYVYKGRSLYEEEMQQSSLFCIAKSNLPAHYYQQTKKVILNPLHANSVIKKSDSYSWNYNKPIDAHSREKIYGNFTNRTAVFGDSIFVLKNYMAPHKLEIPTSFITPNCITTKAIHYLRDIKTSCRQLLHADNVELFAQHYNFNWTVLSSIRFLTENSSNYEGCPKNVCVPFNLQQCNSYNCWNMTNTTISTCTTKMCTNIITKIKYAFTHNGTYGIVHVNVSLTLNNISIASHNHVDQEYEINFLWTNQTHLQLNYSDFRSGNPGYQVGKPILYGKLITVMNSTTNSTTNKTTIFKSQHLQRTVTSYIDNFIVIPKNIEGKCALSNVDYETIEFGINMLTKCSYVQGFVQKENSTLNETCWLLQNNILAYWSFDVDQKQQQNTLVNTTFGYFGNARTSNLKDWGHVLFLETPVEILTKSYTQGNRTVNGNNIVCQNISTRIKYSIFYERVENDQNRIAVIYVEYMGKTEVSFKMLGTNVFSETVLYSEVMFYDVTGERIKKYEDPPSLDIKLPYDFFYPFIKVESNNAPSLRCSSLILFVICSIRVFSKVYFE